MKLAFVVLFDIAIIWLIIVWCRRIDQRYRYSGNGADRICNQCGQYQREWSFATDDGYETAGDIIDPNCRCHGDVS